MPLAFGLSLGDQFRHGMAIRENLRPVPGSCRSRSPQSGIILMMISFFPSTGCQSSFHPGLIPNLLATSAGMVTMFFWVTIVIIDANIS